MSGQDTCHLIGSRRGDLKNSLGARECLPCSPNSPFQKRRTRVFVVSFGFDNNGMTAKVTNFGDVYGFGACLISRRPICPGRRSFLLYRSQGCDPTQLATWIFQGLPKPSF